MECALENWEWKCFTKCRGLKPKSSGNSDVEFCWQEDSFKKSIKYPMASIEVSPKLMVWRLQLQNLKSDALSNTNCLNPSKRMLWSSCSNNWICLLDFKSLIAILQWVDIATSKAKVLPKVGRRNFSTSVDALLETMHPSQRSLLNWWYVYSKQTLLIKLNWRGCWMQDPATGHKDLQLLDARTQLLDTALFWCWLLKPDVGRMKSGRLRKFATMTYENQNSHDGTGHLAFLRRNRRLMPGWHAVMSSTNLKMAFANWMSPASACAELNRFSGL